MDVELVIKIPEGLLKDFETEQWTALSCMEMKDALMNGTQLPEEHGNLIDEDRLKETIYRNVVGGTVFNQLIDMQPKIIEKK